VQDKRHGPVQPITVPAKLPVQRASDEIRDAERRPIDMDAPCQPAILILPRLGPYGWEVAVGLVPVGPKCGGLMGNKPERPNAGRRVASLALPVHLLALELDLGLQPN
jgi:hypothetical protein